MNWQLMNWRRGLWRLWLAASALWALLLVITLVDDLTSPRPFRMAILGQFFWLLVLPPTITLALARVVGWVAQGFRKDIA